MDPVASWMKSRSLEKIEGREQGQNERFESRNNDVGGKASWRRGESRRHVRLPAASKGKPSSKRRRRRAPLVLARRRRNDVRKVELERKNDDGEEGAEKGPSPLLSFLLLPSFFLVPPAGSSSIDPRDAALPATYLLIEGGTIPCSLELGRESTIEDELPSLLLLRPSTRTLSPLHRT